MQDEQARIVPVLESGWRPDDDQQFRFHWRRDATVTLDLFAVINPQARSHVKFIARLSTGVGQVAAPRVLPPWIVSCSLCETCFTPAYARIGLLRLTYLELLAPSWQPSPRQPRQSVKNGTSVWKFPTGAGDCRRIFRISICSSIVLGVHSCG